MSAKTAVEVKARLLDLTTGVLELVRDGNRDAKKVCEVLQTIKDDPLFASRFFTDVSSQLWYWKSFYKRFFGLDLLDFSSVRIPDRRPGFDRLLIIAQSLTPNKVYEAYERHGIKCWRFTEDLDSAIDWSKEERNPQNGHYAIWTRGRQEADDELKNLSANDLQNRNIKGITLLERMVFGLKYWSETGKHLDENNITLCSGSRVSDGIVPRVGWDRYVGGVGVSYYCLVSSYGNLRAREVVSF